MLCVSALLAVKSGVSDTVCLGWGGGGVKLCLAGGSYKKKNNDDFGTIIVLNNQKIKQRVTMLPLDRVFMADLPAILLLYLHSIGSLIALH